MKKGGRPPRPIGLLRHCKKFKDHMQKGNDNAALKLLTNNIGRRNTTLNEETFDLLGQKHPEAKNGQDDIILQGPVQSIYPI